MITVVPRGVSVVCVGGFTRGFKQGNRDFAERMTLFDEIMRLIIIWEEGRCKIGKNLLIYELVRSLGETSRCCAKGNVSRKCRVIAPKYQNNSRITKIQNLTSPCMIKKSTPNILPIINYPCATAAKERKNPIENEPAANRFENFVPVNAIIATFKAIRRYANRLCRVANHVSICACENAG